ncbi:GNAT family N-acetyltransferase [Inhella crocodyli]|jgi:RimJ/RimL family protein N-acetyltransferase|uniref:GNAT family N-acetyltransferase n=1 Tax=Inhella crocodyli TaxID=2499851 RepID=A0A437LH48_9BURK|nr:GNAT family N-acetyltransferase [Inhella crocodyli]RVT84707.1 GNAT family N-acetyltransferase [Inhella crocodyli]
MPASLDAALQRWRELVAWVPIRALARRHRRRLLRHLLALSPADRYLRFGYAAGDAQITRYALSLDFQRDEVLGIFNRRLELVAAAHVAYPPDAEWQDDTAEFGVSVLPRYRGRGLGGRLFQLACLHARNRNKRFLLIHALSENAPMLRIAERAGAWPEATDGGTVTSRLHLPSDTWRSHTEEAIETQLGEWDFRFKHQAKQLQDFVDTVQGEVRQLLGDDAPPPPPDPSP